MKEKVEKVCTREELADYLEKLASDVRSGSLGTEAKAASVPDQLDVKILLKEKNGQYRCKVAWRWSSLEGYEPAAKEEILRRASDFKQVKKDLARTFKQLKQTVARGALPDEEILKELQVHSGTFTAMADPDWQHAASEFAAHLENLFRAWHSGQLELVAHEVSDLENRMVACHREFR